MIEVNQFVNDVYEGTVVPKSLRFSAGEQNPTILVKDNCNRIIVTAYLQSSDDFMELVMVTDAIKRQLLTPCYLQLMIGYLPYSRQDRVCNPGEAHGAAAFGNLVNALGYDQVTTYDAHSDVGPAVINNCINYPVEKLIREADLDIQDWVLVCPDAGAEKKVLQISKDAGGLDIVYATKVRDTETGQILKTEVQAESLDPYLQYMIVDDICDGGMTFIKLTEALRQLGASFIDLWVTHGIFSKGYEPLFDAGISRIYTTNSFDNYGRLGSDSRVVISNV